MREEAAPRSEWAELFASLSREDTSDTIDTRSSDTPRSDLVSAIVKSGNDSSGRVLERGKPAETLDSDHPHKPSVASVARVILENEKEIEGPAPARFRSFDTSATLATQVDAIEDRAARWAAGYAAISTMPAPAGFSLERWQRIVAAAGKFLHRWAAKAIASGWSDVDVFGVDPRAPDRRFDCMGLVLLLDRMEVVAIDPEGADLRSPPDAILRFRRRPLPAHKVSLWNVST